jgi:hypothetical protein
MEVVGPALDFYRSRQPVACARCVRDGLSCSQRFEQAFLAAKKQGKNELSAAATAIDQAATVCQEINGVSKTKAVVNGLLLGTLAAIAFGGGDTCSGYDGGCPMCPAVPEPKC